MPTRIGVQLHPQHASYDQLADAAKKADELGFDTLWTWDHFFPLYGTSDAPLERELPDHVREADTHGSHFEGWTLLTAFACLTSRIEMGLLVTCNGYRNVNLLADMARTVDHISHGRLILGIGSGWYDKDYAEYGYEFGTPGSRLKLLEKSLPVLIDRLEKLQPPPARDPLPLLIAGGGETITLKLVAKYATMWNYFGSPKTMAHKMQVLDDWCAKFDRNPQEIERTILMTDESMLENLDEYHAIGIRHFIFGFGPPFDFSHAQRLMDWRSSKS